MMWTQKIPTLTNEEISGGEQVHLAMVEALRVIAEKLESIRVELDEHNQFIENLP